jgi:perosamine synthetase
MKNKKVSAELVKDFKKIFNKRSKQLHTPSFAGNEIKYLKECIDTRYVSYVGEFVKRFEKKLSNYTQSNYSIAVNSGTAALHLVLHYLNINEKNEVLLPSLTYVATANAIRYCNAEPNFVDIEKKCLGVCPIKLEKYLKKICIFRKGKTINKFTGKELRVLIVVHLYGFPAQISELKKVCKKYNLLMIEDAAEALGSFYKKKHLGTWGDFGILSFNGNKIITTGGGGAILAKKKYQDKYFRHLSTHAKLNIKNDHLHDQIGFNYRMTNLSAAVGCAQLENINKIIKSKRFNYQFYKKKLEKDNYCSILQEPKNSLVNYWLITAVFENNDLKQNFISSMNKVGLRLRNLWRPLHTLKIYNHYQSDNLDNSNEMFDRALNLPSSPFLFNKFNEN